MGLVLHRLAFHPYQHQLYCSMNAVNDSSTAQNKYL
jgi:hypothetical protein